MITDLFIATTTLMVLAIGLLFKFHRNKALLIFTFFSGISNFINPFFFMANSDIYTYLGWGAVRSFDFTFESLSYSFRSSNIIISSIIIISLLLNFFRKKSTSALSLLNQSCQVPSKGYPLRSKGKYTRRLVGLCAVLFVIYYFLYNSGIGITGIPGELPFHLSGIVHYIRTYFIPIIFIYFLARASATNSLIITFMIYAIVAGIAASSRFVGITPIIILIMHLIKNKRYKHAGIQIFFLMIIWFVITASRDLTFDGSSHNLISVIFYGLTNISFDDLFVTFDFLTGRLSGAQQIVLANQLRGIDECRNVYEFLFGIDRICGDTALVVFGIHLSGTGFGTGLSLIPSIVISDSSFIGYIVPIFWISYLLTFTQFIYNRIEKIFGGIQIESFYLFLSVLFIFLGQMLFFYILQLFIIIIFIFLYIYRWLILILKK
jgi:hypothetical protein